MASLLTFALAPAAPPRRATAISSGTPEKPATAASKPAAAASKPAAAALSLHSASTPWSWSPSPPPHSNTLRSVRCRALGEGSQRSFDQTVYRGVYGPWTVESEDVREVILYRCGLVTTAASFILAASTAFLPEGNFFVDIIKQDIDFLFAVGAGGLGLSLLLIHIYVTPIKRFLQLLWLVGVFGSIGTYLSLAQPLNESLIQYIIDNPVAVWFVGPLFAALTGLVFKEGLCYGKLEAGILTFTIPALLLGHLSGLMDNGSKLSLLGIWMALFLIFAARKFQQPIKDDIGDKSVFIFNALPEEEKKVLLKKLEQGFDQKLD